MATSCCEHTASLLSPLYVGFLVTHLRFAGFNFHALPGAFVVHMPHPKCASAVDVPQRGQIRKYQVAAHRFALRLRAAPLIGTARVRSEAELGGRSASTQNGHAFPALRCATHFVLQEASHAKLHSRPIAVALFHFKSHVRTPKSLQSENHTLPTMTARYQTVASPLVNKASIRVWLPLGVGMNRAYDEPEPYMEVQSEASKVRSFEAFGENAYEPQVDFAQATRMLPSSKSAKLQPWDPAADNCVTNHHLLRCEISTRAAAGKRSMYVLYGRKDHVHNFYGHAATSVCMSYLISTAKPKGAHMPYALSAIGLPTLATAAAQISTAARTQLWLVDS
eukprot:5883940-Pleurochrysis_carterae.AAC.2